MNKPVRLLPPEPSHSERWEALIRYYTQLLGSGGAAEAACQKMTVHQRRVAYSAIGHSANALRACLAHLKNSKNRRSLAVAELVGLMCLGAATASTA
jgi:hypothetical protein